MMSRSLSIIKAMLILGLLLFISLDLRSAKDTNAEFSVIKNAVVDAAGFDSGASPAESRQVKRFLGLNSADYEEVLYYAPSDNMSVQELFLVKVKDLSQKSEVISALEDRLETQKKSFDGYGVDQTNLLKHAVIRDQGLYILYICGENAELAEDAFITSAKER